MDKTEEFFYLIKKNCIVSTVQEETPIQDNFLESAYHIVRLYISMCNFFELLKCFHSFKNKIIRSTNVRNLKKT